MDRYQDIVYMSTRSRVLDWLPGITKSENIEKVDELIRGYSYVIMEELDRYIKYRERTEYFDVPADAEMDLHLRGWPIGLDASTGDPLVAIYNDNATSPTYSTALTYPNQYRVYPGYEEQGLVEFLVSLVSGPQALKVTWTGGMATKTVIEGSDGVNSNPGTDGQVDCASATFEDDLVEAGMTFTLTDGTNTETKDIKTVNSNTQLIVDGQWNVVPLGSGRSWIVNEAGFVGAYPDIEMALIVQSVFHWKQKDKLDIQAMSVQGNSGMNTTFTKFKPMELLPEVKAVINRHHLKVYP